MEKINTEKETIEDEDLRFGPYSGGMGLNTCLSFLDIDFDGIPELFAGCNGIIGSGTKDVFKPDGTKFASDFTCASALGCGCIVDNVIYMPTGRNIPSGWYKLVDGTPSDIVNIP